ncbi:HTH-type transcriptional regulator GltC [Variibacter gotjawalensis]|uniref:HTH-type transcriptional regulator GltC n=1 Tax=Variibacter gotjawalensis TaxID=1333996 RepID=A0A0S3PTZ8_9BRAD|nr:LysR family transcriptional regulator [Variibacter gotjawalensis]NIK49734.1 DNA-binding transcriptional LysR family regulator [Variibacter gotjawalensis]RZS45744.1 DNA-binding transcriptional LysR family regulator [Variibacter gotjawalensis]BAT59417.1 HTH-type transcriptional regulator GltC [Variibacter gotjawalensis]
MNITSHDLQIFLTLAQEKSFTRAAARCGLSQSAFSTRVSSLEHALGAKLFDRTTRRVELTADGEVFEPFAHQLFADLSDIVEVFRDRAARRRGRVAIAALPSVAAGWMPTIISRLAAQHPNIQVMLRDEVSETCVSLVRSGDVDLGLTTIGSAEDLERKLVATDRFYLVCQRGHPLLARRKISPSDIAAHPFIHLTRNSSVRRVIDTAFEGMELKDAREANYMATVAAMVEAGLGVTIVPSLSLHQFARPMLSSKLIEAPHLSRPIYLISRRGRTMSAAADALSRAISTTKISERRS